MDLQTANMVMIVEVKEKSLNWHFILYLTALPLVLLRVVVIIKSQRGAGGTGLMLVAAFILQTSGSSVF